MNGSLIGSLIVNRRGAGTGAGSKVGHWDWARAWALARFEF